MSKAIENEKFVENNKNLVLYTLRMNISDTRWRLIITKTKYTAIRQNRLFPYIKFNFEKFFDKLGMSNSDTDMFGSKGRNFNNTEKSVYKSRELP